VPQRLVGTFIEDDYKLYLSNRFMCWVFVSGQLTIRFYGRQLFLTFSLKYSIGLHNLPNFPVCIMFLRFDWLAGWLSRFKNSCPSAIFSENKTELLTF
jgi:hypothetical protein